MKRKVWEFVFVPLLLRFKEVHNCFIWLSGSTKELSGDKFCILCETSDAIIIIHYFNLVVVFIFYFFVSTKFCVKKIWMKLKYYSPETFLLPKISFFIKMNFVHLYPDNFLLFLQLWPRTRVSSSLASTTAATSSASSLSTLSPSGHTPPHLATTASATSSRPCSGSNWTSTISEVTPQRLPFSDAGREQPWWRPWRRRRRRRTCSRGCGSQTEPESLRISPWSKLTRRIR